MTDTTREQAVNAITQIILEETWADDEGSVCGSRLAAYRIFDGEAPRQPGEAPVTAEARTPLEGEG